MDLRIFSVQEIDNARRHKYSGTDKSILVKLVFRRWWDWLIQFVPMWVAPNLITLVGFLVELFSFIVSFVTSNELREPCPCWVCFLNGVCLFIYQTLDNLDGRQARRTGNSSPLGQFFDHGCDAITGVLEMMKVAATLGMGCGMPTFLFILMMAIGFSMTSFEEYVTHSFYLGYINGADEGLAFLTLVHILCVFDVDRDWGMKLVNPVTYVLFCICEASAVLPILYNVIVQSYNDREKARKAIISILPIIGLTTLFALNVWYDPLNAENPYFIMFAGLGIQLTSQITLVAYLVLRQPQRIVMDPFLDSVVFLGLFGFLFTDEVWSYNYWIVAFALVAAMMLMFDCAVVYGLSVGLGIPVLTVRPQETPEETRDAVVLPVDLAEADATCETVEDPLEIDEEKVEIE